MGRRHGGNRNAGRMAGRDAGQIVGQVLKFVVLGVLCVGGLGFVIMWLWNWLVPELFHGPHITFWQSLGILLLSKLLFGWHNSHGHDGGGWGFKGRKQWKEKMMSRMERLDPEQRERIRERFSERFGDCASRSRFGRGDWGDRRGGCRDWREDRREERDWSERGDQRDSGDRDWSERADRRDSGERPSPESGDKPRPDNI